jgi:hypothetical protein
MKGEQYWRSDEGHDEYARLLEAHVSAFTKRATSVSTFVGQYFDVKVYSDFPNEGMYFHVTSNLSGYILDKGDGTGIRQEIAWTTTEKSSTEYVRNVLLILGYLMLKSHSALEAGVVLSHGELAAELPNDVTARNFLTRLQLWLEKPEYLIESYFPTFFIELVPITDDEKSLVETNEQEFYERCADGRIDFMNLAR